MDNSQQKLTHQQALDELSRAIRLDVTRGTLSSVSNGVKAAIGGYVEMHREHFNNLPTPKALEETMEFRARNALASEAKLAPEAAQPVLMSSIDENLKVKMNAYRAEIGKALETAVAPKQAAPLEEAALRSALSRAASANARPEVAAAAVATPAVTAPLASAAASVAAAVAVSSGMEKQAIAEYETSLKGLEKTVKAAHRNATPAQTKAVEAAEKAALAARHRAYPNDSEEAHTSEIKKLEAGYAREVTEAKNAEAAEVKKSGYKVKNGQTLLSIVKELQSSGALAEVSAVGKHNSDKTLNLAMALVVARKNNIENIDVIQAGGKPLMMPTAEEVKNGLAHLATGLLSGKSVSYTKDVRGHSTSELVGDLSAPPLPAGKAAPKATGKA